MDFVTHIFPTEQVPLFTSTSGCHQQAICQKKFRELKVAADRSYFHLLLRQAAALLDRANITLHTDDTVGVDASEGCVDQGLGDVVAVLSGATGLLEHLCAATCAAAVSGQVQKRGGGGADRQG